MVRVYDLCAEAKAQQVFGPIASLGLEGMEATLYSFPSSHEVETDLIHETGSRDGSW